MQRELFASSTMPDTAQSRKTEFSHLSTAAKTSNITMDRFLIGLLLLIISYVMIFSWGVDRGRQKAERAAALELKKLKADIDALSQMTFEAAQVPPVAGMGLPNTALERKPEAIDNSAKAQTKAKSVVFTKAPETSPVVTGSSDDANGPVTLYARPTGIVWTLSDRTAEESRAVKQFTVQLATYVTQSRAEKQVAILKNQGIDAFIVPSGSYFLVCADRFSTKDLARSNQRRIQKETGMYMDAYIRTAPSI